MTPLVSIIIPAYNHAKLLRYAISSALNQTYTNLEVLVMDDASTDNTEEIVKSFQDKRLIYYRQEKNIGLNSNWNSGIEISTGQFITDLDADDYLPLDSVQLRLEALQKNKSEVVFAGLTQINNHVEYKYMPPLPVNDKQLLLQFLSGDRKNYGIHSHTSLYSRSVFKKIGLRDPNYLISADYEFSLRVLLNCRCSDIDKNTYFYRFLQPKSLTSVLAGSETEQNKMHDLEKEYIQKFKMQS